MKKPNLSQNMLYFLSGILFVFVLIFASAFVFSFLAHNKTKANSISIDTKNASVSGIITYSGLKPDEGDKGEVVIEYRKQGEDEFKQYPDKFPLENNAHFILTSADTGQVYHIRPVLVIEDKRVVTGDEISVTAPASNQVLQLHVTWDDLPDEVAQEYPTTVSGQLDVHGFIPNGAIINIYAERVGTDNLEDEFRPVESSVSAKTSQTWQWDEALNGREYKYQAEMYLNGTFIGESDYVISAAPSNNVNFVIQSNAQAPEQKGKISGIVYLNGIVEPHSEVDVHVKVDGGDWTKVSTVPAINGSKWSWSNAIAGKKYKVKAIYDKESGDDPESSESYVTAPADGVELTVDTGKTMKPPKNSPDLSECKDKDGDRYTAVVKFDKVDGAKKYLLQVGTSEGNSNTYDAIIKPDGNSSQKVEFRVKEGKRYYSRYAYSTCSDCAGDSSFSPFSDSESFKCD